MVNTIAMIRPKASHTYTTINISILLDQRSYETRLLRLREQDRRTIFGQGVYILGNCQRSYERV